MSSAMRSRAAGWLAVASIAMIVILNGAPLFTNASRPPRGIASPIVAIEVARNVDEVDAILSDAPSPDREAMRIKQYLDFAFIACYAGLYIALARWFGQRLAVIAAICGLAAAVFDVVENFAILRILDLPLRAITQGMIDAIRYPSLAKWTLAFVASALFGVLFWKRQRRRFRFIALLNFAAAALGIFGLYDNSFLVWAGIPLAAGLLATIAAFLLFRSPSPRAA
ncbi:MAG: hypothetical protein LAO79_19640 [Acidobacteriia bacterium]|nr:hypothetical protein [Terriglobia bacterium]